MRKLILNVIILFLISLSTINADSPYYEISKVEVEDKEISEGYINYVVAKGGEEIKIDVWVRGQIVNNGPDSIDNVRIKAWIDEYIIKSSPFTVESSGVYHKTLYLELPDNENSKEYILNIEAYSQNDYDKKSYNVEIIEQIHDLKIQDVILIPSPVTGKTTQVNVRVENNGNKREEDIQVKVSIPELEIEDRTYIEVLEQGENSGDVNLFLSIPENTNGGDYKLKVELIYDRGYEKVSEEYEIHIEKNITPPILDYCDIDDGTKIKIGDIDFDNDEYKIGDKVYIEIEDVEATIEDLEDVEVEVCLYNLDNNEEIECWESDDKYDIDEDEKEDFEIEFRIPNSEDIGKKDSYRLIVIAIGDDEDGDRQCVQESEVIKIERETHDVMIKDAIVNPDVVEPGDTVEIIVRVENIGTKDEDDCYVRLRDDILGIDLESNKFDLDDYTGDDNDYTVRFNALIPENIDTKEYLIEAIVYFDDGDISNSEFVFLRVEENQPPIIEIVSTVPEPIKVGDIIDFSIGVSDSNNDKLNFTWYVDGEKEKSYTPLIEEDIGDYKFIESESSIDAGEDMKIYMVLYGMYDNIEEEGGIVVMYYDFLNDDKVKELLEEIGDGYEIMEYNGNMLYFLEFEYEEEKILFWIYEDDLILFMSYNDEIPNEVVDAYLEKYPSNITEEVEAEPGQPTAEGGGAPKPEEQEKIPIIEPIIPIQRSNFIYYADERGKHEITVIVSDGEFEIENIWKINVENTPPTFYETPVIPYYINEGDSHRFDIQTYDPDGDEVTVEWYLDNNLVSTTDYFTYFPDYNSAGTHYIKCIISDSQLSDEIEFDINVQDIPKAPKADTFTTDFSQIPDLKNAKNIILEKPKGKIDFGENIIDISNNPDLDSYIIIEDNLMALDTSKLNNFKDKSARITIKDLDYEETPIIYYNQGFTLNKGEINEICPSSICSNIVYENNILSFDVAHFSSFSTGQNYKDLEQCSLGIKGNLEILIKEPDNNDDFKPGNKIPVEVKVKNNDNKNKEVNLEVILYDIDEEDEIEKIEDTEDISKDDSEIFKLELELADDLNDKHDYLLYVKAYEDGNEDEQCSENIINIDIKREDYDVIIKNIEIEPKNISCDKKAKLNIELENKGRKKIKDAYIELKSSALNINLESEKFSLNKYNKKDNKIVKEFNIEISEEIDKGAYFIEVIVHFDDKEENRFVPVGVENCKVSKEDVFKITTDTEINANKKIANTHLIIENKNETVAFGILDIEPVGAWFSPVNGGIIAIEPGKNDVYLNLKLEDINKGKYNAVVTINPEDKNLKIEKESIIFEVVDGKKELEASFIDQILEFIFSLFSLE